MRGENIIRVGKESEKKIGVESCLVTGSIEKKKNAAYSLHTSHLIV